MPELRVFTKVYAGFFIRLNLLPVAGLFAPGTIIVYTA